MFTISQVLRPLISVPLKRMLPESGLRIPMTNRINVVFPAPLGPIRPTISWRPMAKLISLVARSPPKLLARFLISSKDSAISALLSLFSEFAAGYLSHIRFRQLASKFDDFGDLVVGQVILAI